MVSFYRGVGLWLGQKEVFALLVGFGRSARKCKIGIWKNVFCDFPAEFRGFARREARENARRRSAASSRERWCDEDGRVQNRAEPRITHKIWQTEAKDR
jgi:hypothetical protein